MNGGLLSGGAMPRGASMRGLLPPLAPGSGGSGYSQHAATMATGAHMDRMASVEVRAVQALSGLLGDDANATAVSMGYQAPPVSAAQQFANMHSLGAMRPPLSVHTGSFTGSGALSRLASGEVRAVQALSGLQGVDGQGYGLQDGSADAAAYNCGWPAGGAASHQPGGSPGGYGMQQAQHNGMDDATEAALLARVLGLSGTAASGSGLSNSTAAGYGMHHGAENTDDVHQVLQSLFGEDIARELAGGPHGDAPAPAAIESAPLMAAMGARAAAGALHDDSADAASAGAVVEAGLLKGVAGAVHVQAEALSEDDDTPLPPVALEAVESLQAVA